MQLDIMNKTQVNVRAYINVVDHIHTKTLHIKSRDKSGDSGKDTIKWYRKKIVETTTS
jgi:hypothetical protein